MVVTRSLYRLCAFTCASNSALAHSQFRTASAFADSATLIAFASWEVIAAIRSAFAHCRFAVALAYCCRSCEHSRHIDCAAPTLGTAKIFAF